MDVVEGKKGKDETFTLSLLHTKSNLQLFFKLKSQTQQAVSKCFGAIRNFLGDDLFKEVFTIILTDNGSCFQDPLSIITSSATGEILISIFYCEPRRSDQKGKCEKNHVHFRECYPKGISMNLLDKKGLNYISNQINNYPRKSLEYNSPYQIASLILNKKALELNNLTYIHPSKVCLNRFI
jgi:IS30 family transposase